MVKIEIKVIPRARKESVIEEKGKPLAVKVKEPAINGKANNAALKLLSKYFNARVSLVNGAKSRKKIIEVLK